MSGTMLTYSFCNEVCIFAMGGVPIASIEYSDGFAVDDREGLEEADEPAFIIELQELAGQTSKLNSKYL